MKNFKWSDVELIEEPKKKKPKAKAEILPPEDGVSLEVLKEIAEAEGDDDMLDEATVVEGYCLRCGDHFIWSGPLRDLPTDPCKRCNGEGNA